MQVARVPGQDVERRHVERDGVAEQDARDFFDRHILAALGEDEREFTFGVDVVGQSCGRQDDLAAGFEERRGRLHEAAGFVGLLGIEVFGVRLVIEADAPDFAGPFVGNAQASVGKRDRSLQAAGEIAEGGGVRIGNELEQIAGIARTALDVDFGDGQQPVVLKDCGKL